MSWVGLQCVSVVFPDHTQLRFDECKNITIEIVGFFTIFFYIFLHSIAYNHFPRSSTIFL